MRSAHITAIGKRVLFAHAPCSAAQDHEKIWTREAAENLHLISAVDAGGPQLRPPPPARAAHTAARARAQAAARSPQSWSAGLAASHCPKCRTSVAEVQHFGLRWAGMTDADVSPSLRRRRSQRRGARPGARSCISVRWCSTKPARGASACVRRRPGGASVHAGVQSYHGGCSEQPGGLRA